MKRRDLFARNLRPARIVANDCDHRHLMSNKGIEFAQAVTYGAITVKHPYVGIRMHQFCAQGKTGTHPERSEDARIKPAQRSRWADGVRGSSDEITAIA